MPLTPRTIKTIISWIVATIAPIAFIVPMYYFTNFGLSNCFLIPTILYLGYVALLFICRWGTFDLFRYQFINWISFAKKDGQKKYKDAYEYKQHLEEVRSNNKPIFLPWLVIGALLLVGTIVSAVVLTK